MEIGPQIPNYLLSKTSHDPGSDCCDDPSNKTIADKLNEHDVGVYGPALPPSRNTQKIESNLDSQCINVDINDPATLESSCNDTVVSDLRCSIDGDDLYGPVLPPGFKQKSTTIIGPSRPQVGNKTDKKNSIDMTEDQESHLAIGPMLPSQNAQDEYVTKRKAEIESRARVKKDELFNNKVNRNQKIEREEWMTELPPELGKNFGLGPRKFRNKEVNLGDRSVWTETPSQRENKQKTSQPKLPERREKSTREVNMEQYVSEHNKRYRSESLLDLHQKDQKKRKQTDGSSERRPFDRETDLAVRQMDAAKRKSLIKTSSHLNSKFENSKQGPTYL